MLKALKNAWTLIVNLGWVGVLGVFAAPYVLKQEPSPPAKAAPFVVEQITPVVQPVEQPKPDPEPVVQKAEKKDRDRIFRVPDPEPPSDPEPQVRSDEEESRPPPGVVCSNGMCYIVPSLRYKGNFRIIPRPDPDNNPTGPETAEFSKARATNAELRWALWSLSNRLVWNDLTTKYMDLSKIAPRPPVLDQVYTQNWELTWRIIQVKRLMAGQTPDDKVPPRPPGRKGKIGALWSEP